MLWMRNFLQRRRLRKMTLHFREREFDCKCGCGKNNINLHLFQMWNEVREICGFPITVSSGSRCIKWNKQVGGKDNSAKISGDAGDVKGISSMTRLKIIEAMLKVGFTRIGVGKTIIHGDIDKTKPRYVMWLY